jgi:hypothetical protein
LLTVASAGIAASTTSALGGVGVLVHHESDGTVAAGITVAVLSLEAVILTRTAVLVLVTPSSESHHQAGTS